MVLATRIFAALLVAVCVCPAKLWSADNSKLDEYALMAIYAYNFAKFTQWPSTSFATTDAPLNFCVLGADPFGIALAKVEGKRVRGHPVRIKRYPRVAVVSGCHIVFVSRSEQWRLDRIVRDLRTASTLTVSDIPDFSRRGGMITLAVVDRKVRFAINPSVVVRAGLKLSSKLLELARIVDSG